MFLPRDSDSKADVDSVKYLLSGTTKTDGRTTKDSSAKCLLKGNISEGKEAMLVPKMLLSELTNSNACEVSSVGFNNVIKYDDAMTEDSLLSPADEALILLASTDGCEKTLLENSNILLIETEDSSITLGETEANTRSVSKSASNCCLFVCGFSSSVDRYEQHTKV